MTVERMVEILNQYPDISFSYEGDSIAIKDFVPLLARQIPKMPLHNIELENNGWGAMYRCGACKSELRKFANYCDRCGRPVSLEKKNTEIPARCCECEYFIEHREQYWFQCRKHCGRRIVFDDANGRERMKWCPLIREALNRKKSSSEGG